MQDLKVTIVQTDLFWEKPEQNRRALSEKLANIQEETHLVILPEMFSTGFTMKPQGLAGSMEGETVKWMSEKAKELGYPLCGSVVIFEEENYYNRFLWASPKGELHQYDKRHLFRMAGEEKVYTAGEKRLIIEYRGWRIAPFICYDLRFPIFLRNLKKAYDLALFVANWPEKRSHHWKSLLMARAIENHCFVVGVNRVGRDGNGITYSGDSRAIDPMGKILWEKAHHQTMETVELKKKILEIHRENFPVWMDEDHQECGRKLP